MQDKSPIANKINKKGSLFGFIFSSNQTSLFYYSVIVLFVYLADSIMSYVTPGFLEEGLSSTALMGIVFATSSLVGFIVDFLLGEIFPNKNYKFFLKWSIILAIGFPVSYLVFPSNILTFLLGLAIWGVYFELISFSNSRFIIERTNNHNHETAWGIMFFFRAASLTFGPVLAALLLDISYNAAFITAIVFIIISGILYLFEKGKGTEKNEKEDVVNINLKKEIKIWNLFSRKLWPLLIFCFGIVVIDASFWSIGTIFAEELHTTYGGIPGLLIVLYSLPMFFTGFFAKKFASPYGKKRAGFLTALVGSIFLILAGLSNSYLLICIFTFLSACFFSISFTEIKGAFADYGTRIQKTSNSLIGLEAGMYSLAYVLGPILSGILADQFGIGITFSILGIGMILIIFLCLLVVPRKIKLPQNELESIED